MAFENGHLGVYTPGTSKDDPGTFESAARPLTDAEKSALQAEATANPEARPYRNGDGTLTDAGTLCLLVNGSYVTANPTPQGTISLPTTSKHDFAIFFGTAMAKAMAAGGALAQKWMALQTALLPFVALQDNVPIGSVTIQGLLDQMVSDGIATQADRDAFDKTPDPAWQADALHPARASVIFATPLTLEPADWEGIA